jgi:hypothetical protein
LKFEEETSLDQDVTHSAEILGYIAMASAGDIYEERYVAEYLGQTNTYGSYDFEPDWNASMNFASSNLQNWRQTPNNDIETWVAHIFPTMMVLPSY